MVLKMRAQPLSSFAGFVDIKLGASVITLFAVLNKIAGVYGVIAVFAGGTFAQISMYAYSIATLAVFLWGLKSIGEENPSRTLTFAHLFTLDHLVSTTWTAAFAVIWWYYTPHDGRRVANSSAQEDLMRIPGASAESEFSDTAERTATALALWKSERGFAAVVIIAGWLLKIYFALCLYSFALHLRRGTYHQLPLSRPAFSPPTASRRESGVYRYSHVRSSSAATTAGGTAPTDAETPIWAADEMEMERPSSRAELAR